MNAKRFLVFAGRMTVVLPVTTFAVGLVTYPRFTQEMFENPDSVLRKIFRTPADPELWNSVHVWIFPVQILRAVLIAVVLYPFFDTLVGWSYWKWFLSISGLIVILGHLAGTSGITEGLYMMRPEFVTSEILAKTLPEPIIQGLLISAWISRWMTKGSQSPTP